MLIQGIGAALLMPSSLAIVGVTFDGEACGRAIGIWAAAVGPVLGGWLVDAVSWRMIFFLNLPVAAGAIASGASLYPRGRRERWGAPGPVERVAGDRWPRRPDGFLPYVLIETGTIRRPRLEPHFSRYRS